MGHPSYWCLEKGSTSQGSDKRANIFQEESNSSKKNAKVPLESK